MVNWIKAFIYSIGICILIFISGLIFVYILKNYCWIIYGTIFFGGIGLLFFYLMYFVKQELDGKVWNNTLMLYLNKKDNDLINKYK
jgi:hypothetical protein